MDCTRAASVRNGIKRMLQRYDRNSSNYGGITAILAGKLGGVLDFYGRFLRTIDFLAHISLETGQMLISLTAKKSFAAIKQLF